MDEIQKILIKAGRKDLAQKYYEKIAAVPTIGDLAYAGRGDKTGSVRARISIPISFDWHEEKYTDRKTKEESPAKGYELDYDRELTQKAIEDQIIKIMEKETKEKELIARGDWANIGFLKSVANHKYKF